MCSASAHTHSPQGARGVAAAGPGWAVCRANAVHRVTAAPSQHVHALQPSCSLRCARGALCRWFSHTAAAWTPPSSSSGCRTTTSARRVRARAPRTTAPAAPPVDLFQLARPRPPSRLQVITFTADLGQGEELEPARAKAQKLGVRQIFIDDLREARALPPPRAQAPAHPSSRTRGCAVAPTRPHATSRAAAAGVCARLRVPDVPRQLPVRGHVHAGHFHRAAPDREAADRDRARDGRGCGVPRRDGQGQRPGAL